VDPPKRSDFCQDLLAAACPPLILNSPTLCLQTMYKHFACRRTCGTCRKLLSNQCFLGGEKLALCVQFYKKFKTRADIKQFFNHFSVDIFASNNTKTTVYVLCCVISEVAQDTTPVSPTSSVGMYLSYYL